VEKSSRVEAPQVHPTTGANARVDELHRRIEELEALAEDRFGRFGAVDWIACVLAAVVLPVLLVLWFAR